MMSPSWTARQDSDVEDTEWVKEWNMILNYLVLLEIEIIGIREKTGLEWMYYRIAGCAWMETGTISSFLEILLCLEMLSFK